jgi:hypothetical protein
LGKNPHERLKESALIYSASQPVMIGGKELFFIRRTSDNKYLFYLYENKSGMFITTFYLFSMNEMGDFFQLSFSDGIDKIETSHDHAPEIVGNHLEIKLRNEKRIDVSLVKNLRLIYDADCSISKIK